VKEAVDLRHGVAGDPEGNLSTASDETPAEALAFLRRVRPRADRVDELLAAAKRARGRLRLVRDEAKFQADSAVEEKWADKASKRVEFSSSFERGVEARTETFEQRRDAHQAARLVSVADDAVDVISQCYWGLDGIRKDLRSTLHALQFEYSLER